MKINFSQELKTIKGLSFTPRLTLAGAAVEALLSSVQGENMPGDDKARNFELALRLVDAGEPVIDGDVKKIKEPVIDVTIDEAKRIKDRIGVVYPPAIVGRAWQMLEQPEGEKQK